MCLARSVRFSRNHSSRFLKAGQLLQLVLLEHAHREERDEPHHRPHLQRHVVAVERELVVVEAVLLVPEPRAAEIVHRVGDGHEVLEELAGQVLVRRVRARQLQRHGEHGRAVEGHPRGAVGLLQRPARGQRLAAIEHADVVEPQEAAREEVAPLGVLAVHPPGEVHQELVEDARQEGAVARALGPADLVDAPRRPGVHRRVHVREVELVRGQLAVGVHVPLAQEEDQLLLGEGRVEVRERHHVKRQVPRGEPRVLPLVWHRQDVAGVKVAPVPVAGVSTACGRRGRRGIALEPGLHVVPVELLGPHEPGVPLPQHLRLGRRQVARAPRVEGVGLGDALLEDLLEARAKQLLRRVHVGDQPQPQRHRLARLHLEFVARRALGARARRVDRALLAVDHQLVKRVLHVGRGVGRAVELLRVGLVLGEDQLWLDARSALGGEAEAAQRGVRGLHLAGRGGRERASGKVALGGAAPRPGVADPQGRQDLDGRVDRAAVGDGDAHQHVIGAGLGVLGLDVEVAVALEDARVRELELALVAAPAAVLLEELLIRESLLGVLVEPLQVRMRRRRVEVVVALLHVLAVVALGVGQPEQALLEDGVLAIPQGERKAEAALPVGDAEQPVLAPAVDARPRLLVVEVAPAVAARRVVLAHRAPLALGEVRAPALPVALAALVLAQTALLGAQRGAGRGGCDRGLGHG